SFWDRFEVVRIYRGVRYVIQVKRKGPGNNVRLEVEGVPLVGNVLKLPPAGTMEVQVNVSIGV
ncbi:MAG: hypothetical protein WA996_06640, partial [Candidatus Promineifilaceae bacterium]